MLFRARYLPAVAVLSFLLASDMSVAQAQSRPKTSSEITARMKSSREGYEEILAAYEEQLKSQLVELERRKKLYQEGQLAEVYIRLSAHNIAATQAHIAEIRQWIFEDDLAMTERLDRKSTRLNSSHVEISYAVFCL